MTRPKKTPDASVSPAVPEAGPVPPVAPEPSKTVGTFSEDAETPEAVPGKLITLDRTVYPSDEKSISVAADDEYGGAHTYVFQNSLGFSKGKAQYHKSTQYLQFVKKEGDEIIPGVQSEQLIIAIMDRTKKLNAKFPDPRNDRMLGACQAFLQACKERVDERIERGIMGELKK